jgi:hypothetical protein
MTKADKARLALAAASSVAAMIWLAAKEEYMAVAGIAFISVLASYFAGRKW